MKKILVLSSLAVVLTGCSTGETRKTKPVSELNIETTTPVDKEKATTTVTTQGTHEKEVGKEGTESSNNEIKKYVGTYKSKDGFIIKFDEGLMLELAGGYKTKVDIRKEGDIIRLETGLKLGGLPEFYAIYPTGVPMKGELDDIKAQDDPNKYRILMTNKNTTRIYFFEDGSTKNEKVETKEKNNSGINGTWFNSETPHTIDKVVVTTNNIQVLGKTYSTTINPYEGGTIEIKLHETSPAGGVGNFYYIPSGKEIPTSLLRGNKSGDKSIDRLVWISGTSGSSTVFTR